MSTDEGVVYVAAAGTYYSAPEITSEDIVDALHNGYVQEQLEKTSAKIFNGMYSLSVKDPDGEELEDVAERVRGMAEASGVLLWARMKQAWVDMKAWGCLPVFPKWIKSGGETVLAELRRLPPESFGTAPDLSSAVYSDLLPGITLNADGEVELYQTQDTMSLAPVKLKPGVILLKNPGSTSLTGDSTIVYLVPVVRMLDFCWEAQMQKINRVGSPIFLIRINGVKRPDDVTYAQSILKNWGKSTAFQLRENMEVVELDLTDNEAALNTIAALEKRIAAPFRPASSLDKEGSAIGGNAAAQKESEDDWVQGERTIIEDQFEALLQQYLDKNGYEGCTVEIRIAVKQQAPGELELNQAKTGFETGCMSINELREKLGLEDLSEDELVELMEERAKLTKVIGGKGPQEQEEPQEENPFGDLTPEEALARAEALGAVQELDPMDPEAVLSKEKQLAYLRVK